MSDMSDTQKAIALLIKAFTTHAGKDGDANTLSKAELKELLKHEFGDMLGKPNDQAALDKLFKSLDSNGDQLVDFKEFGILVVTITCLVHEMFSQKA